MRRTMARVAIVTGSGSGIGRQCVFNLADEGLSVVVCDMMEDRIDSVTSALKSKGKDALGVRANVSVFEEVNQMVATVLEKYHRVDVLVNSAGTNIDYGPTIEQLREEDWDKLMAVNLKGIFNCCKAVFPHMKKNGGSIVNIASILGAVVAKRGSIAYHATKGGILGLTRSLAADFSPYRITVNAIAPGLIETPLSTRKGHEIIERSGRENPTGRAGMPVDVANLVSFLTSEKASFINAQCIAIDGGESVISKYP